MDIQPKLLDLEEKSANTVEDLLRVAQEASAAIEAEEIKAYLEDEQWIRDQRYRLERLETNHTMNVFAAKVDPEDPDSKPLFTNDTSRKAEVARRLSEDPAYQEQIAALMVMEKNQKLRRIHIDKLTRDYQLARLAYAAVTLGRRGLGEIDL